MSYDIDISFPGGKKVDAHFKGFTVHTDQAIDSGGEGSAPEPFDSFFVSIATCAGIYALEFCSSRGIKTEGLKVKLAAEKNESLRLYDPINIYVTLPEGFPEKYRNAIVKAVNLCTVKKHIEADIHFNTEIVK